MDTYQCENCGEHVELEKSEMMMGNDEPYEFGLCPECFDKAD